MKGKWSKNNKKQDEEKYTKPLVRYVMKTMQANGSGNV